MSLEIENKIENSDTWLEIVKVLDKYSIEAWRSGALAEQDRIIEALDFALIYDKPVVIQRYQLVALIKGEK